MFLRSVEYGSRMVYCISLERLRKEVLWMLVRGAEGFTIRSIRTDRKVLLRSVEYSLRIAYCISLGIRRKKTTLHIVREAKALTIRSIRTDR